jgi:flavin-dependent dehydrogenase
VLLVDKAKFPRPKVCGCCVNGAAIRTLSQLGLSRVVESGVPLREVRIGAGSRSARVRLPAGVAISRTLFDAEVVREAVNAGAHFRDGVTAKVPDPANATTVQVGNAKEHTRVVIYATGLAGADATPEPGSRVGAGVTVTAEHSPADYTRNTIYMATGRGGYVGLVRVEDDSLDIAAAFDVEFVKACGGLGSAAEAILASVRWPPISQLAELPWKGTPALTRRANRLAGERWFAVGDAAGYVEPFTGEGMAWAIASAAALAPIAARAAQNWNANLAREWEHSHARVIAKRQRVCRVVSRVLRSPATTGFAVRALSWFPVLARPVVASLNRPSSLGARI